MAVPASSEETKDKRPSLSLRAMPRFAFSPVNVLFVAELQGGDDIEDYYCPEVEWEWDDGGKSVKEADCPPFVAGETISFTASASDGEDGDLSDAVAWSSDLVGSLGSGAALTLSVLVTNVVNV